MVLPRWLQGEIPRRLAAMTGLTLVVFAVDGGIQSVALDQYRVGGPAFQEIRRRLDGLDALNGLVGQLSESRALISSLLSEPSPDRVKWVLKTHSELAQSIRHRLARVLATFPVVEDRSLLAAAQASWEAHALAVHQRLDVPGGVPSREEVARFIDGVEGRRHARIVAQVESARNALRLHVAALESEVEFEVARVRFALRALDVALGLVLLGSFIRIARSIIEPVQIQTRLATHEALRADAVSALSSTTELPAALLRCCESLAGGLEASSASIWVLDKGEQHLELCAIAGEGAGGGGGLPRRIAVGEGEVGRIAKERRPHHADRAEGGSFAGQPLMAGESLLGVMAVFASRPFPPDTVSAMGAIADAIAQGMRRRNAELALASRAAELARSNADLERFAYVASHDLQEPLRMIASYAQLLARRYRGRLDATADEFIGFLVEGVTRMKCLIEDLLAYSRIEAHPVQLVPIDCGEVVRRVIQSIEVAVEESDAEITLEPLPTVLGERGQLDQLFQNLLGNALKFRRLGCPPRIRVSAERQGDCWVFSVRDNGIGIDPQYFERIFLLFQRLHGKDEYPGTGIGLALCKRIVERHGGRIWVEPSPEGGSTFYFTIPIRST